MMVPQQQRRRRRRVALPRTCERRVVVARGTGGFGFTIAGQRPCVVSAVAAGGPAERAGLLAGDALVAVDGASVARAPHAAVARLVAGAPGAIALSVTPRDAPPTDTEDTEPDERCRTRRRHPPPRRRPQAPLHHPGCHAASSSGVNDILQHLGCAQLAPSHAARLECRAVVGYLGTIETPQAAPAAAPGNVRSAVRKLRQERRPATPVLLSVLPNALLLRRPGGQALAQYPRERIVYAGCGSDADRRYFGLVTSAEGSETEASHSCHVFAVDPRMADHEAHTVRAREFQIACTRDPVAERCLEFPPSAEYVVGVTRGMYSLPSDDCNSPTLAQLSRMAVKGDSPALGNFSRNRAMFRAPRDRRCREDVRIDGQDFVSNSPQPSNHSEMTTTSSNSDSGIGFHNDCRNITDRILVVDFVDQQPLPNRFRKEVPRRPVGLVGCSIDDSSFLSNTTPVVDGFAGQGRPLNLDDVILNANDLPARHVHPDVSPRRDDDNYNYNNIYSNMPSTSRSFNGDYDQVYTENEGHQFELVPQLDCVTDNFNSVEIYEERSHQDCNSNESVENVTVISGGTSKASMDSVSVCSSRSHEEARPSRRRHLQASLDDMLVLGRRHPPPPPPPPHKDEGTFVHPASVKCKVRKSMKPLNLLSKTKSILSGHRRDKEERRRAVSASAGDARGHAGVDGAEPVPAAASEPDLRDAQSEQDSPFRRWTTGGSAGGSYRQNEPRTKFSKQMSESPSSSQPSGSQWRGRVARWSLGLEHLLADPYGVAAFAKFLQEEYAEENIRFYVKCERFLNATDLESRARIASQTWHQFLDDRADFPVNVDASAKRAAALLLCESPLPSDVFQQAQSQIFALLKFDSYPRFLRSAVHAECARADLRGEAPPYGPYALPPDEDPDDAQGPSTSSLPSTSKHTKSTSASDCRWSGGGSLLPWCKRAAPRGRSSGASSGASTSTPSSPVNIPSISVTDVVTQAGQSGQYQGSLCRVVLPDGATSVVEVDETLTVRRVVDRLLERRNSSCNYDVIVRDANNQTSLVDALAPSTVLGGREACVERRCVVRIEVGGRCVAVRCRAARRLRHVLRPVLARYPPLPPGGSQRAVVRDGSVVHPDTSMQELDGARLQIVELTEGGQFLRADARQQRGAGAEPAANGGDKQIETSFMGRCRADRALPPVETISPYVEATGPIGEDTGPEPTSPARTAAASPVGAMAPSLGASAGGRVRAALRPGPPLHHHPPDFLENLRETQRQRLQNGDEPSPAPRTPPPLPPKPRRIPTLV